jgi:predicted TIM-barrel fold metal-dependent hydrolase
MIIDMHGHIGRLNFNPIWTADADKLQSILEWAGVDYCVVSSAKAIIYDVKEGNREVIDAVATHSRILGYMVASPLYPNESIEDLKRAADHPQLVGCKMHPDYHGYDISSRMAHKFVDQIVRYTNLILFHSSCMPETSLAAADKILELAREHPETNFILAHAAGLSLSPLYPYHPNYRDAIERIEEGEFPNVYLDTANGTLFSYPRVLETVVAKLGAEHILFGTDVPIVRATRVKAKITEIKGMDLSSGQKQRILGLTAQKLLVDAGAEL